MAAHDLAPILAALQEEPCNPSATQDELNPLLRNALAILPMPAGWDLDGFCQEAASCWSALPPQARTALMGLIEAGLVSADPTGAVLIVYNVLAGLVGLPKITDQLPGLIDVIVENNQKVMDGLTQIKDHLARIEAKLDDEVVKDAHQGMRHLVDAANSPVDKVREQNLGLAIDKFTRLMELDPKGTTNGSGVQSQYSNISLITVGYWGSHIYFGMMQDRCSALLRVYECTRLYPLQSCMVFPPSYYSQDYRSRLLDLRAKTTETKEQIANVTAANRASRIRGAAKDLGVAAGGAAGLVAGSIAVATVFTGGLAMIPVLGLSWGIGRWMQRAGDFKPYLQDVSALKRYAEKLEAESASQLQALTTEATTREAILQKVSLTDLLAKSF